MEELHNLVKIALDEIERMLSTKSVVGEAITVEGNTIALPKPFFMIATENPVEFEGTFPLPEAQKDRFFLSTRMGYPPEESEKEIMESQRRISHPVTDLQPVTNTDQVIELQKEILSIMRERETVEEGIYVSLSGSFVKLGLEPIIFDIKDITDVVGMSVIRDLERVKSAELDKHARIAEAFHGSEAKRIEAENAALATLRDRDRGLGSRARAR